MQKAWIYKGFFSKNDQLCAGERGLECACAQYLQKEEGMVELLAGLKKGKICDWMFPSPVNLEYLLAYHGHDAVVDVGEDHPYGKRKKFNVHAKMIAEKKEGKAKLKRCKI